MIIDKTARDWEVLLPFESEIQGAFARATKIVDQYLPVKDVQYLGYFNRGMRTSAGGSAPDGYRIRVSFNPFAKDDVNQALPIYMAHERHHIGRHRGPGYGETLGERLVSEGLAVVTEYEQADLMGIKHPHASSYRLGKSHRSVFLEQAKHQLGVKDRDPNDKLWRAIKGYGLGRHIVQNYQQKNGNPSAVELINTPASEILAATFG